MLKLSAWLAVTFGTVLTLAQVYRNFDNWGDRWITWGIDVLAGVALVGAGVAVLRRSPPRYLAAAWAFASGLYVSSLISYSLTPNDLSPTMMEVNQRRALILTAVVAASLVGLAASLLAPTTAPPNEDTRL